MRTGSITLTIDSRLEDVSLVSSAVRSICEEIPLSEMEAYQVETCVVEAVNNVILHAYGNRRGSNVTVVVAVGEDRLTVEVRDRGRSMEREPEDLPEFDPCDTARLPENGWGWKIMRSWMDDVSYTATRNQNVLRLVKQIVPSHRDGRNGGSQAGPAGMR